MVTKHKKFFPKRMHYKCTSCKQVLKSRINHLKNEHFDDLYKQWQQKISGNIKNEEEFLKSIFIETIEPITRKEYRGYEVNFKNTGDESKI